MAIAPRRCRLRAAEREQDGVGSGRWCVAQPHGHVIASRESERARPCLLWVSMRPFRPHRETGCGHFVFHARRRSGRFCLPPATGEKRPSSCHGYFRQTVDEAERWPSQLVSPGVRRTGGKADEARRDRRGTVRLLRRGREDAEQLETPASGVFTVHKKRQVTRGCRDRGQPLQPGERLRARRSRPAGDRRQAAEDENPEALSAGYDGRDLLAEEPAAREVARCDEDGDHRPQRRPDRNP